MPVTTPVLFSIEAVLTIHYVIEEKPSNAVDSPEKRVQWNQAGLNQAVKQSLQASV